jgi:hypothetical protein
VFKQSQRIGKVKIDMSKQHNKAEKGARRKSYLKRKKVVAKTKVAAKKVAKAPATA